MLLTDGVQDRDTRAKRVHQDLVSAASRGLPCVTAESLPAHTDVAGRALSSSKCSCCNYPRWCGFRGCGWCACLAAGGVHETVPAGLCGQCGTSTCWSLGPWPAPLSQRYGDIMHSTQPVCRPRTHGPCQLRVPVADDEPQSDRDKRVTIWSDCRCCTRRPRPWVPTRRRTPRRCSVRRRDPLVAVPPLQLVRLVACALLPVSRVSACMCVCDKGRTGGVGAHVCDGFFFLLQTKTAGVLSQTRWFPGAASTPRSAPEPERVKDEVEKLLALVRVTRNQI